MKKSLISAALLISMLMQAQQQISNWQLDSTFAGWQTIGNGISNPAATGSSATQPFMVSNFGPNITPQYGYHMAQLSTGGTASIAQIDSFAHLTPGTIALTQTCTPTYGSAISQTIAVTAGEKLYFHYLFTTTDDPFDWDPNNHQPGGFNFNDFAFVSIGGSSVNYATMLSNETNLYNLEFTYGQPSGYLINGHYSYPAWFNYSLTFPTTDTVTITIGIMNSGDNIMVSDLLVDMAFVNTPPSYSPVTFSGLMNQNIPLSTTAALNAFTDPDTLWDSSTGAYYLYSLPAHGTLIAQLASGNDTIDNTWLSTPITLNYFDSIVYVPDLNFVGTDSVQVILGDGLDYSSGLSWMFFDVATTTGFAQNEPARVTIFPNPAADFIHLQFASSMNGTAHLIDMNGKEVSNTTMSENSHSEINVSDIARGNYLLEIRDENGNLQTTEHVILR